MNNNHQHKYNFAVKKRKFYKIQMPQIVYTKHYKIPNDQTFE